MEINRDSYLDQLIEQKHNGLVKVITNLRRIGKSFLLFNLFKLHLLENVQVSSFSAPWEYYGDPMATINQFFLCDLCVLCG